MAWSSTTSATQLTSITTEQFYSFGGSTLVTLNPGESGVAQIKGTFGAGPTDDLTVSIYATPDAGTTYDNVPYITFTVGKVASASAIASVVVNGIKGFRVGVKRSGTTDTIPSADAKILTDGISV